VNWSSALLMSGSLQQNVTDATINEWRKRLRARIHPDGNHFEHLLSASYRTKKLWTNEVWFLSYIPARCSFMAEFVIFSVLKFSKADKVGLRTLNGWGGRLNHLSMAYLLSNTCTKITGIGQLLLKLSLVVGWYTFWDTVYFRPTMSFFTTWISKLPTYHKCKH